MTYRKTEELQKKLVAIAGDENVAADEPMSRHTTFRIGGPCDYFVTPSSLEDTRTLITFLKEEDMSFFVMGNGSNLLVADEGYRGIIVSFGRKLSSIAVKDEEIRAEAGAFLSSIAREALQHSLTGFEFASGIPGSLGGACVMNAGAYGGDMSQVLTAVTAIDREGGIHRIAAGDLRLGYRHSIFMENDWIVAAADLKLAHGDEDAIRGRMDELREKRQEKQPLEYPSAGSTFKRPEGYFAGKLIMDAGLRGYTVGGASVSEKHCGFIINRGGATSGDVRQLIRDVQKRVYEDAGVELQPEVCFLGF
ncbi:MAG: UDP-N-acetylmuramate dehydrogenase [Lachnospiraceae bacterium]|nr:UDP-N-acetylmuramate dehydrogenase [Lachnospiraceae bacterium]